MMAGTGVSRVSHQGHGVNADIGTPAPAGY
jgi:hypothetical protein